MTDIKQTESQVPNPRNGEETENGNNENTKTANLSWLSLLLGLAIMAIVSVYPMIFADKLGKVDHWALMILMWAMAAGLIRGVGFIPKNIIIRIITSTWFAYVCFAIAIAMIVT